ncbi:MAG: hypothetical protein ACRD4Y_13820, partial [Candidatus Acidiferrales bacterium]
MTAAPVGAEQPGAKARVEKSRVDSKTPLRAFRLWTAGRPFLSDLLIAGIALLGILAYFLLRFGFHVTTIRQNIPLFAVLLLGGAPLVIRLIRKSLA